MVKAAGDATPAIAERFTCHGLRAKSLSDAKSLKEAQQRGGHVDSKITQRAAADPDPDPSRSATEFWITTGFWIRTGKIPSRPRSSVDRATAS
jgi:integrase